MNKGDITDTEMNNILDGIVDSLFSLFATLGSAYFNKSLSFLQNNHYYLFLMAFIRYCTSYSKSQG